MKRLFLLLAVIALFASCTGTRQKEYAYNEFVSHMFLEAMDQVDGSYKKFSDGSLLTGYEFEQEHQRNEFTVDRLAREIALIDTTFAAYRQRLAEAIPSEKAKAFHQGQEAFYAAVHSDYLGALKEYKALNVADSIRRQELREKVHAAYAHVESLENELPKIQIEYAKSIGMKLNEE